MSETDGRLAPVTYLPGVQPPSVSFVADEDDYDDEPDWNDTWGEFDDSCARLTDAAAERDAALEAEAEKVSFRALTRRGLSQRELERALRDHGIDEDTIGRELERLTRVGLVDDVALAQTLVASLQERKGLGRTAIAAELTRRMFAPAAIEYALELVDSGDELARAKELARKRAGQLGGLDRDAAVRRLSGYLARRGYSGSAIRAAVEQALPARSAHPAGSVRFR